MAIENAKKLNVRIRNKYDSYESWMASGLVLEAGEIAIAHTTVDVQVDNGTVKQPALLMKVGDGAKTFANLPWLSAKAADVLSVCKSEADLKAFVNGVIADAGIASDEAMEALAGRVTTAEGAITALQAALGKDGSVAQQIESAIEELNLADTYAAKEHTHTKAEITDFAHGHVMADVEGLVDALAGKQAAGDYAAEVHTHVMADVTDLADELAKYQLKGDFAAEEHGHVIADVEGLQDALDAKAVKTDVDAKIEALEAEDLRIAGLVATAQGEVDALELVVDTKADKTALEEEVNRAKGVEGGLEDRIETMEAFWAAAQADGTDSNVVDTLKEIQEYIVSDETGAAEMLASIQANAKAISDHEALAAQTYETKEDATAKYNEVKAEIAAIPQADWNQNDPAAADYVKNRTHYEESVREALAVDYTFTTDENGEYEYYSGRDYDWYPNFVVGDTYIMVVNGTEYEVVAQDTSNLLVSEGAPISIAQGSMGWVKFRDAEPNTAYTLSVYHIAGTSIKQLDEKFIPDTIARVADVEAVETRMGTAEGKITTLEGKVSTNETAISALQEADAGIIERVAAVEAQLGDGEGSVADMIADAKAEAISEAVAAAGTAADTKDEAVLAAAKKYADDEDAKIEARVDALETDTHTHGNKALLDTYTQTEANLADAVAKKHEHSNLSVLETITAAKVAAWEAAEQAAKTYADGLNTAMDARVAALEALKFILEGDEVVIDCGDSKVNA